MSVGPKWLGSRWFGTELTGAETVLGRSVWGPIWFGAEVSENLLSSVWFKRSGILIAHRMMGRIPRFFDVGNGTQLFNNRIYVLGRYGDGRESHKTTQTQAWLLIQSRLTTLLISLIARW